MIDLQVKEDLEGGEGTAMTKLNEDLLSTYKSMGEVQREFLVDEMGLAIDSLNAQKVLFLEYITERGLLKSFISYIAIIESRNDKYSDIVSEIISAAELFKHKL